MASLTKDTVSALVLRRTLRSPISASKRLFSQTSCQRDGNAKRHRRKLAMPQAPSFAPKQPSGPKASHILFNPPPSMPNVYHTPLKFLPPNDPRRQLYSSPELPSMYNLPSTSPTDTGRYGDKASPLTATPVAKPGTALHDLATTHPPTLAPRIPEAVALPPPVPGMWFTKTYLTQAEVDEIRRLRTEAPREWTVSKLKAKFNCAAALIKAIAAPQEAHDRHLEREELIHDSASQRRREVRRDRARRRLLWSRDA